VTSTSAPVEISTVGHSHRAMSRVNVTVVGRSRSAADDTGDDADLNADLDAAQHDPLPHHAD
jgi:hypothetical protein